uniref:B-cell lymphoma/leukemia 10 n=1 Tax=Ictidomys tridecemlineatus TaxID=43179 RepID=I3N7V5_ICTTR
MEPTALSLTEEDLTEVKKDALENLRVYLCEKIIAERHFDHLRAKKILSREDTEEISCRTSSRKRAGKLLDYLQENPKGLDTLVESIRREKTQNFLIQKITDEVLKLRNIKLEHLKGKDQTQGLIHASAFQKSKIKCKTKQIGNNYYSFFFYHM